MAAEFGAIIVWVWALTARIGGMTGRFGALTAGLWRMVGHSEKWSRGLGE